MEEKVLVRALTRTLACALAAGVAAGASAQNGPPRQAVDADQVIRMKATPTPKGNASLPSGADLAAVEIDARIEQFVARLGDPVYRVREEATAELLGRPFNNWQLYAILARGGLTAEQRHRLIAVIHDRLVNTPRGAIGIKVLTRGAGGRSPNEIIIEQLLPDLPARDVLEVGDRITRLHGEPLANWRAFVKAVQSRPPGSKITVTVERPIDMRVAGDDDQERQHQTLEFEIELGSARALPRDPATGRPPRGVVYNERVAEARLVLQRWGDNSHVIEIE